MQISAYTDTGRVRSTNQDYIYASQQKTGPLLHLFTACRRHGRGAMQEIMLPFLVENWWLT